MGKNYSNVAVQTTLSSGVTSGATSLTVAATTGFPSPDFTLVIDPDTASEELVLVTGVGGTTLTVTRGYDGTTAVAHDAGAVVRHVHSAKDFKDSRDHEAATAAHGATGAVVGTTNTQTLTNKTLTSPTINGTTGIGGAWQTAASTFQRVDSGTTHSLGNGTCTNYWVQVGKTVHFRTEFTAGSTTTYGTGNLGFTLPVAPKDIGGRVRFVASLEWPSSFDYAVTARMQVEPSTVALVYPGGIGGADAYVTQGAPMTLNSSTRIVIQGTYEAA